MGITPPTPPLVMTVSYKGGKFTYGNNKGNMEVVSTKVATETFIIHFKRVPGETWKFTKWTSRPRPGSPPETRSGLPVLEMMKREDDCITVRDRVDYKPRYRYKYTIWIEDNGVPDHHDPEIENRKEPGR
jgi:hypothetical protein